MNNNKAKEMIENALTSLTESLEAGQSDELKRYLQTMSRFQNAKPTCVSPGRITHG